MATGRIKHCTSGKQHAVVGFVCEGGLDLNKTVVKSQIWSSRKQVGFQKRQTGSDNGVPGRNSCKPECLQTLSLPLVTCLPSYN